MEMFLEILEGLAGKVDAMNLPEGRSARIHLGSLAASLLAKDKGLEPILTLSCRDRNRISLSSDLLGAYAMGIENVLCVTGDYFNFGDTVDAKPVYDLDSVQAIQMIHELVKGKDIGGNALDGAPRFCVGCVANPEAEPLEPQLLKLEKKLAAGARFIQTLDIFDLDRARYFFEHLKDRDVTVLAGIRLITEREVQLHDTGKFPGNPIPESIVEEIRKTGEKEAIVEKAKARMKRMIKEVKDSGLCRGVHLTVDGHEGLIPEILQEVGL
jgi:5,10-methylenetetrahydrofolate reductase